MQQDPLTLDNSRKTQLDSNIKKMLEGGASNDDVMSYASDFKNKFGVKKKDDFQVDSQIGSEPLPIGSKPFQAQVDTKPAPYVKPKVKPKNISEAVEDDNNYLGAIYNNLIGAGSDFIGGFARLVAKSNPYGSPVLAATADVLGSKAEQVVEKLRSGSSSKQYEEKIQQGFDLTKGVFTKENAKALPLMISRFAGDLGLAIPTAGASYLAQNYNQGLKEFDKAIGNRTTDDPASLNNARELFGVAYSTISSVADKYSLGFMTKSNPVAKKVKQAILKETVQELATKATGKITADVIEETASRIAKKGLNKFKSVGLKGLTSAGVEGGTEVITGVGTDLAKMATNLLTDKNIFNEEEVIEDFWKNRLNEFGGGAVLGGITGSAIRGIKSVDDMVAERVSSATNLNNVVAVAREIEQDLITRYNEGSLDVDRYDEIIKNLNKYVKATESIPFDIGAKKRKEAIQSIVDRDRVAEEIKVKQEQMSVSDESLVPQAQQELDILEAKKQSLNDNIVEATADEKFKYSKDPEKDLYYKQLGEDGELEEISKQQYELETQSVPKEKAQEIKTLAKPTFDTEEQLVEEIRAAEKEFNETGDSAEYQLKINDLNTRLENLVPAPEVEVAQPTEEAEIESKKADIEKRIEEDKKQLGKKVLYNGSDRKFVELTTRGPIQLEDIEGKNEIFIYIKQSDGSVKFGKAKRDTNGLWSWSIAPIGRSGLSDNELFESLSGSKIRKAEVVEERDYDAELAELETPKPKIDAVQVEAAGQVPVLTEAPVGEEVEQGKPQPEAEVVTEEGVKAEEKIKTAIDDLQKARSVKWYMEPVFSSESIGQPKSYEPNGFTYDMVDTSEGKATIINTYDAEGKIAATMSILDAPSGDSPKGAFKISTREDVKKQGYASRLLDEASKMGYDIPSLIKNNSFSTSGRNLLRSWLDNKLKTITQEQTPAQKVEQLRAAEQVELKAAIPNADQYLTDGKVDRAKITDAKDLKKFDKIYDKYDKLITPRLKEAKADAEVAKLYALLGTPDGEPRFRLSDEVEEPLTSDVESIEKEMNAMPEVELNFTEPEVSQKGLKVDPVSESNSLVKIAKKVGDALLKPIQFFNGIPMITGMSDILSAGKIKDSTGKPMDVEGGLLFNVLGKNKNAAWAGVDKKGAKEQYDNAVKLYNSNKELFDRLWSEGRLPDGHVPMAIMRMGNEAVNSNEAVFRWVLPTIEGLPKQNRIDAMNVFTETLQSKSDAITNKLNEFGKGKLSQAVLKELGLLNSTLKFIKDNKITDLGQFFKEIVSDSNKRAKGNSGSTLSLPNKTFIYNLIFAPKRIKTASKPVVKALLSGTDNSKNKIFTSDFIYSSIGEPSMLKSRQGEVVSIVGIDVKNGGVIKVDHGNYGFGPKGKTIALIENPTHGIDVFPEWKAKASRVFKRSDSNDPNKEGKYPSPENVATQTGGAFFGDSAMKGAKVFADVISDLNLLIGKLRYAFPSVSVSTTQEEFNNIINSPDVRTQVSDGKVILGLTKDGKIYLNPEMSSLQTPIHEFGHIWIDFLRSKASGPKGTAFLNKGLELVKNTKEHKKAIEKYGDTEIALEEALVELMANKGATIISAAQRSNFLSWMNGVFKYIQQKFTTFDVTFKNKDKVSEIISKLTLDEFINIGLADLFSGKELSTKFDPGLSESAFKARMSAITDINEIVKIGLDNGISIDSITKVLKDKNFNEKEISLAVYNAISKDIKLDESNVENAIELLDEIEDNKRKAERASSKRKADLEQKISEAETELDKIQEEAKIVKVINDNFDKIKKDLKEQGLLNVKC